MSVMHKTGYVAVLLGWLVTGCGGFSVLSPYLRAQVPACVCARVTRVCA